MNSDENKKEKSLFITGTTLMLVNAILYILYNGLIIFLRDALEILGVSVHLNTIIHSVITFAILTGVCILAKKKHFFVSSVFTGIAAFYFLIFVEGGKTEGLLFFIAIEAIVISLLLIGHISSVILAGAGFLILLYTAYISPELIASFALSFVGYILIFLWLDKKYREQKALPPNDPEIVPIQKTPLIIAIILAASFVICSVLFSNGNPFNKYQEYDFVVEYLNESYNDEFKITDCTYSHSTIGIAGGIHFYTFELKDSQGNKYEASYAQYAPLGSSTVGDLKLTRK